MTSSINPNNIDGAYPVAGQDNDSQGFRDNFTNTRTNFQFAAQEITDLQNKAVLKAPLTGTTLNNNMGGSVLSNAQLQNITETAVSLGTASGSVTINYTAGPYQTLTTGASVSLAFAGLPAAGVSASWIVRVTVANVAHTLTLPASVGASASSSSVQGIQGWSSNVITFAETGTYEFRFDTIDGGVSVMLSELTRPRSRYTNPIALDISDSFGTSGNINLGTTTTIVTSNSNLTGNLLAGSSGQIKILAYGASSVGNTLITVTNAAWGGAGLANLSAVGSSATFQYIGNKWFCVGNNGVTFS
jgi:hypothetical protein